MAGHALLAGILSSFFFVVLNVAMNIYMKWLFDPNGGDFALPWTMLAVQQLQAFIVLQPCIARMDPLQRYGWDVGRTNGDENGERLAWRNMLQVFAATTLFCFNVGLNSLSLVQISITLNQTVRAFLPVGVLLLATVLEQRAYPSHSYVTTVILVGGIALTCWGSPDFEAYGFMLAFISTLVAALGTSLNGRLLSKGPFSKSGPYGIARLMMIQSVPAFLIFGATAAFTEGAELRAMWMDTSDGAAAQGRWTWHQRLLLVSVSSLLALMSNLGRCFLVAATSALMETLAGNAKVAALCAIDHQLFGTALFPYNYLGIALTFFGFSIHVLLQYASKDAPDGKENADVKGLIQGEDDQAKTPQQHPLNRPRLISAADTGLAAEHVAMEMGRPTHRTPSDENLVAATESQRQRAMTWPAPRPQDESNWIGVDFSRVFEVPLWLDGEGRRASGVMLEEYRPLNVSGHSPAGGSSGVSAAGQSPQLRRSGSASPMSPAARARFFTDPVATSPTAAPMSKLAGIEAEGLARVEEGLEPVEENQAPQYGWL